MKEFSKEWMSLTQESIDVIQSNQLEIPVRIGEIALKLGLSVKISTLDVGISGLIKPIEGASNFKIIVNKHEPNYRKRFTLAHEVAHFLLHKELIGDGLRDNILYRSKLSDAREAEANRLASDILMPRDKIKTWMDQNSGIRNADAASRLAEYFDVSDDAMRIRLGMK